MTVSKSNLPAVLPQWLALRASDRQRGLTRPTLWRSSFAKLGCSISFCLCQVSEGTNITIVRSLRNGFSASLVLTLFLQQRREMLLHQSVSRNRFDGYSHCGSFRLCKVPS